MAWVVYNEREAYTLKMIHYKTKNGLVPLNTFLGVVTQYPPQLRDERKERLRRMLLDMKRTHLTILLGNKTDLQATSSRNKTKKSSFRNENKVLLCSTLKWITFDKIVKKCSCVVFSDTFRVKPLHRSQNLETKRTFRFLYSRLEISSFHHSLNR